MGAVLALGAATTAMVTALQRDTEPAVEDTPTEPAQPTSRAQLEATRLVTVSGSRVTVRETTQVADGGPVSVAPTNKQPAVGIEPGAVTVVGEDGSRQPFTEPVSLQTGRSITVQGSYRLSDCPDLLPTQWPSPIVVVPGDWTRTFTRVEGPQRTARALCPPKKSNAKQLRGLGGTMVVRGRQPIVRLSWSKPRALTVRAVGSASGVAVSARGPRCRDGCVARAKPRSSVRIALRPLEACPIRGKSNLLTLRVSFSSGGPRTVGLNVKGLGRRVCSTSSR
jgi:hypothetical protein